MKNYKKNIQQKTSHEHWDKYYSKNEKIRNLYLPSDFLISNIQRILGGEVKKKPILETGCGKALESIALSRMGADVTVVDYSEKTINLLLRKCAEENISLHICQGDLRDINFENESFDVIFHSGVLEHFSELEQDIILKNQWRWLKKGGFLFVEVPQRWNIYTIYKKFLMYLDRWPPGWETEFSVGDLRNVLQRNGFKVLELFGRDFFTLMAIRKIKKLLGFQEKTLSPWACWLRNVLQGNRLLRYVYLNIAAIAIKE